MKSNCLFVIGTFTVAVALASVSGCATIFEETSQKVKIVTNPPGADCKVSRKGQEIAQVSATPGTVTISTSPSQIVVECTKGDYIGLQAFAPIEVSRWSMSTAMIPVVGILGVIVDLSTAAGIRYASIVQIDLHSSRGPADSAEHFASTGAGEEGGLASIVAGASDPQQVDEGGYANADGIAVGRYYALVVGIDDYQQLKKLQTAGGDAKLVAHVLESDYGYEVQLMLNPGRDQIIEALDGYIERLGPTDNLLIYYAGHGWRDEATRRGYWLPADASRERRSRWLSNAEVDDTLKALRAKHVMIVADSCYAATLSRSAQVGLRDSSYLNRIAQKRSRVALTSGGIEPVADSTGEGHSPFASSFVQVLRENPGLIDGTQLFVRVRRLVVLKAEHTPEYADIRNAGHDGGDFLFKRTTKRVAD